MSIPANDRIAVVSTSDGQPYVETDFQVDAKEYLRVERERAGVVTVLELDVDYVVTLIGAPSGCRVTFTPDPAHGDDRYSLIGVLPVGRSSSFVEQGGVSSASLDNELDRFTRVLQENSREVTRTMRVSPFQQSDLDLTLPPSEPSMLLGFNSDGTKLALATPQALTGPESVPGLVAILAGKQNALGYTAENAANKNQASGYAGLDNSGKVPASLLPSYVDDVLEFANTGAFPVTGETGKQYVALDTNRIYRWSGSIYVEISPSPGSTDAVPEGAVNLYHTPARVNSLLSTFLQGKMALLANVGVGDVLITMDAAPKPGRVRLGQTSQSLLKSAYPELNAWASAQSYPWGSTSTHFSVPPAAGYFLRFAATSNAVDTSGARAPGSTQADQVRQHNHTASFAGDAVAAHTHPLIENDPDVLPKLLFIDDNNSGGAGFTAAGYIKGTGSLSVGSGGAHTPTGAVTVNNSGGDENRVKNVAMHADMIASPAAANAETYGVVGMPYKFNTATGAGAPGDGKIAFDDANLANVETLRISNAGATGESLTSWISAWDAGAGGRLHIYQIGAVGNFVIADVGDVTDSGAYQTAALEVVSGQGSFTADAILGVMFVPQAEGAPGTPGNAGWSPQFAIVADGARRVQQVVDWFGGAGTKPATGDYVGADGFVSLIGDAVDIRGPGGGDDGQDGWSPELAVISDGARRVHQVVDWHGGEGTKPATGSYIGADGFVALIGDAVDIRGAAGTAGEGSGNVTGPASSIAGNIATFGDTSGELLADSGVSVTGLQSSISDLGDALTTLDGEVSDLDADLAAVAAAVAAIGAATTSTAGLIKISDATSAAAGTATDQALRVSDAAALYSKKASPITEQTGASYTFVLTDEYVDFNRATAQVVTIPPNASVAFPVGWQIDGARIGVGTVTFAAGSGVTVLSEDGLLSLKKRYSGYTLKKKATNTWLLVGNLA